MILKRVLSVCALGLVTAAAAHATDITPGGMVAGAPLSFGGTLVGFVQGSIAPGTFTANYSEAAYSDPNNTFCTGCIDFVYLIQNTGTAGTIEHLTGFNYASFLTSVGYSLFSGAQAPNMVTRTTDGSVIDFNFLGASNIPAGDYSDFLVVQTNASAVTPGLISIEDGSAGTVAGLAPASPVPEPASFLLLGTGLIGIAGVAKRKFGF